MSDDGENIGGKAGAPKPFFSGGEGDRTASYGAMNLEAGAQIGPFKVLGILGEGGYGIVYLAQQEKPIRRRVALKVVKPGMDSKQVIARFEAERQALALFDHPNVAHVFTAGTTEAGRPYFAMEYIEGSPITEYCDREKLTIRERLSLFVDVCAAVQHAHQKGIIHRDLKPSNILIAVIDQKPVVKVIDFGIAKALFQPLTEKTLHTVQGHFVGTPDYMSPEQMDLETQGVDTRSDVYSLGVVLYELLTGVLPFDPEELRAAGVDHIRTVIRDQEPRTPSTRLTSLGDAVDGIADSRRTNPQTLVRSLRRELEWIPLKAMRKERERRYQSPSELAADIQNYLAGRPLFAGPESTAYRCRKFFRRNRGPIGLAAAAALLLAGAFVAITTLYMRAERSRVAAAAAKSGETAQRQIAETERDNAFAARRQAQTQLANLYEERGRQLLRSDSLSEALVYLNEAYKLKPERLAVRFLLANALQEFRHSSDESRATLLPWGNQTRSVNPSGFSVSPNRELVAVFEPEENTISVFDTSDGSQRAMLPVKDIEGVGFTGSGEHIIIRQNLEGSDGYRIRVSRLKTQELAVDQVFPSQSKSIDQLCELGKISRGNRAEIEALHSGIYVSPSGRWLAVPRIEVQPAETQIHLFDLEGEQEPKVISTQGRVAQEMIFSPGEEYLVLGSRDWGPGLYLDVYQGSIVQASWDDDGQLIYHTLKGVRSPNGNRLIIVADGYGELWRDSRRINLWFNSVWAGFSPSGDRFITKQTGPLDVPGPLRGGPPPHYTLQSWQLDIGPKGGHCSAILWNAFDGRYIAGLGGKEITNWHFTPDSAMLITEHDGGEIGAWNTRNGELAFATAAPEGHEIADISPDGMWMVTCGAGPVRSDRIWSLEAGTGFALPFDGFLGQDLTIRTSGNAEDIVFRFSHRSPSGSPRFNSDGTKLITARGLREVSLLAPSPEEVDIWVQANIPLRLESGRLRRASAKEMLDAKLVYAIQKKGANHPNTIFLKAKEVTLRCQERIAEGNLEGALGLVKGFTSEHILEDEEAIRLWRRMLESLSVAYRRRGDIAERRGQCGNSVADYERALQLNDNDAELIGRIAWLKATNAGVAPHSTGNAIDCARRACQLTEWRNSSHLATLALAHAERGDFEKAVTWQSKALELLAEKDRPRWQANFEMRLALYQAGRKYDRSMFWRMPTEHLIAWWRLDDGVGKVATDSSGNGHDGTFLGEPRWDVGRIGGAISLAGGGEDVTGVRCGNSPQLSPCDALTVSAWMRVVRWKYRNEPLITKGDHCWSLRRHHKTDKMRFYITQDIDVEAGTTRCVSVKGQTGVEDGRWHHVVGVYDGKGLYLYIDGILDNVVAASGHIRSDNSEVLIGQSSWNPLNRQWNGSIDDVRIYNRALRTQEIAELFYAADRARDGAPRVRVDRPKPCAWSKNAIPLIAKIIEDRKQGEPSGLAVKWSQVSGPKGVRFLPSDCVEAPRVVLPEPGSYELKVTVSNANGQGTSTVWTAVYPPDFDGLVAEYAFEDGTADNTSSLGRLNGQLMGNAHVTQDPQRGSVLRLLGDSYVDCGGDPMFDLVGDRTLSVWVNIKRYAKGGQRIVGKGDNAWRLRRWKATDRLDFVCPEVWVPQLWWHDVMTNRPAADGQWHHITGVYDGTELLIYLDGALDNSIVVLAGEADTTTDSFMLGDDTLESTDDSDMLIDSVQLYNRALSHEEIRDLYAAQNMLP